MRHIFLALVFVLFLPPFVCILGNIIKLRYEWHSWCIICQIEKRVFGFKEKD